MAADKRRKGFWPLAFVFGLFVLFLYGPVITIFVLSFQGPEGGLTFPMRGWSMHWYGELWKGLGVVDIGAALRRSLALGVVVMLLTVLLSLGADPGRMDAHGRTALDLCRAGRTVAPDPAGHDAVEALLIAATSA